MLGASRFSYLQLGLFWFALQMQTDSEHTDFAFDGEMTATEVCTSIPNYYFRHKEMKKRLIVTEIL